MQELLEVRVQSLDWENSLEEKITTQFSILAYRIPMGSPELGRLKQWSTLGPVQPHLLILESLWESQASLAAHTGDMDTGGSHTKELILLQGHWCWCHFGILPLVF